MSEITLQIETLSDTYFTRKNVVIYQTPRIGERIDLGTLTGVNEGNTYAEVKSVMYPLSRYGNLIPPVVILNESEISNQIMEAVRKYWTEYNRGDNLMVVNPQE